MALFLITHENKNMFSMLARWVTTHQKEHDNNCSPKQPLFDAPASELFKWIIWNDDAIRNKGASHVSMNWMCEILDKLMMCMARMCVSISITLSLPPTLILHSLSLFCWWHCVDRHEKYAHSKWHVSNHRFIYMKSPFT